MQIRDAKPGEGAMIAEEFWYPLAKELEPYSELNELTDDALTSAKSGFEELLAEDSRFIYLLEIDGDEVGFVNSEIGERPTRRKGKYTAITDLYVKEGYRGQGYGTALMERVEDLAEAEGCDFVRVSAEWENADARDLYEKLEYEEKQVTYTKTSGRSRSDGS